MRFYYYEHPITPQRWRAVDVRDGKGLLRHGVIINVVEAGFIVDFLYPGRRSQLIEFGKAFRCKGCFYKSCCDSSKVTFHDPIEALVKASPKHPWTWHPARFLEKCVIWNMFVFVEVEVNGTESKELVPIWQVRLRPSTKDLQERVIAQGCISSRSCRLPKGYREGPVEHDVWEEWKREMETDGSKAYPVCVLGNVLIYVQRRDTSPIESSYLEELQETVLERRETLAKHLKTVSAAPAVISDGSLDMQFSALSLNIINDIFRMLSTVDRTKCRRVCGQWDAILTSGGTMGDIRVSFATSSIWPETQYIFLVSILKSLDPATKWIIIKNCEHNRTFNNLLIECVSWIAKVSMDTNAKKLQIIIHKCFLDDWDADDVRVFIFDYLRSFAQQLFDVAKRLRGTVLVWSSCTYRAPLTLPNVHTPMGKGSMSLSSQTVDSMEATLYSLFEKDLPVLVPLDELSTWISEVAIGGPEAVEKSGILPILNYYGSLDCRMKKLGKFVKSTAGNLKGLDVTKLPKLAVYVLGLKMMSCQANVAV